MGDCLSIHLGESKREKEQNEEVEEICFQALSSSQSAHSHTQTSLSLPKTERRETGRERERDKQRL